MRLMRSGRGFGRDSDGAVALIFALALFVIAGIVGAAVDYSRASQARQTVQTALDAVALVVGKLPESQRLATAETEMNARMAAIAARNLTVTLNNRADGGVELEAKGLIDASLAGLFNIATIEIGARSAALAPAKTPAQVTLTAVSASG